MTISVIGSGKIVAEVLGMLSRDVEGVVARSIFAHRDVSRARQLAYDFGIGRLFTDYDELLREDDSDFIYVANVNSVHYDYALRALQAGRNVIVEKPMCMTLQEAERLVAEARRRGLMLVEAVSLLHMPNLRAVREELPGLGRVRLVECDYSQFSSRYERYLRGDVAPAFDPKLGGGALMDLNVYNINFLVALFGEPSSVEYRARRGFNGVDTSGVLLLGYDDFLCVCSSGKDCHGAPYAQIQGERGMLRVDGPVSVLRGFSVTADGQRRDVNRNVFAHRLAHEFDAIRRLFEASDPAAFHPFQDISLATMRIIARAQG